MLFAIGIDHIRFVLIEQSAVPIEIIAAQATKPAVFFLTIENDISIKPKISRYANTSR